MAKGIHLFPFRTEKLSPLAPMVLPTGGRVGRCRIQMERVTEMWLSLFCLIFRVSSYLILSYLISSCVLCTCSVFFFVMWCFGFFFLFSVFCCILCSLLFALSVALFLRYSIFSFVLFSFCSFLALLWFFAVCLPCLFLLAWFFFLFVYILFSVPVPVSAGYGLFIAFKPVLLWYYISFCFFFVSVYF